MHFSIKDIFPLQSQTSGYTGLESKTNRPFDFSDFKNKIIR